MKLLFMSLLCSAFLSTSNTSAGTQASKLPEGDGGEPPRPVQRIPRITPYIPWEAVPEDRENIQLTQAESEMTSQEYRAHILCRVPIHYRRDFYLACLLIRDLGLERGQSRRAVIALTYMDPTRFIQFKEAYEARHSDPPHDIMNVLRIAAEL